MKALYFEDVYDFSDWSSCEKVKKKNALLYNEVPVFSFLMCVYNDTSLLNSAISSLINQSFRQWELIILDNSDRTEQAWQMICNAMKADSRIIGIRGKENVGWAKGASLCLKKARGRYMSFLAADDCICKDALQKLSLHIDKDLPDVLWVGNGYVKYNGKSVELSGKTIPQCCKYEKDIRSTTIAEIMRTLYYNSFFHYVKIDFLKKHNIDFFEPYYADCAGMTYAMSKAEKMIVVDEMIYTLTISTSQTRGYYIWGSYEFVFALQWKSVRDVFEKENYTNVEDIYYVAYRIFKNLTSNISNLCMGQCRDKYMNSVEKNVEEIVGEIESILNNSDVKEMLEILGTHGFEMLQQSIKNVEKLSKVDCWMKNLFFLGQNSLEKSSEVFLSLLADFILEDENTTCIGWGCFCDIFEKVGDNVVENMKEKAQKILVKVQNYIDNSEENVWVNQILFKKK